MKRIALLFILLFAFGSVAHAQNFTTVTATVVDTNGVPYANAIVTGALGPLPFTSSPNISGNSISPTVSGALSSTGTLTMTVPSNAQITPGSTQWTFTVCPSPSTPLPPIGSGNGCFTAAAVTISGASQDITSTLNASATALTRTPITLAGSCGGVATASQTIFLNGFGEVTAVACTATAGPTALISPRAGTLRNLSCTATAGGVGGGSGVVTVQTAPLSSGTMADTTLTATFGTGTTATDFSHSAAVVIGTPMRIKFTTAGAETLAGVACTVTLT